MEPPMNADERRSGFGRGGGSAWRHLGSLAFLLFVVCLAALALVYPAASLGPADALAAPATLAIDWFYFFPHALAGAITPAGLTIATGAAALALGAMPWIGRGAPRPAAVVDLGNCNGCARCAADCPFGAVVMVPRSDGRPHPREARVDPDLCAACGICAGACPSATPFRRGLPFASGIDLPDRTVADLRGELDRALAAGPSPTIVFACAPSMGDALAAPGTIRVECTAHVPPAFIEYALRRGAREVVLAGCPGDDCEYRLGDRWTRERIARVRWPALRIRVPRERIRIVSRD
jgi:ferredoxin